MTKTPYTRADFERDTGVKLTPGETVFVVQRHVSRSGMSRLLDLYVFQKGGLIRITWSAAKLLGWSYSVKGEALQVSGCGMDMHFHTVYCLAHTYFKGSKASKKTRLKDDQGYWLNYRTI